MKRFLFIPTLLAMYFILVFFILQGIMSFINGNIIILICSAIFGIALSVHIFNMCYKILSIDKIEEYFNKKEGN